MSTIQEVEKVVYTARIHTTGGRDGERRRVTMTD